MNFELLTEENFDKLTKKQQRDYLPAKVEEFVQLMISSSKVTTILINSPYRTLRGNTRRNWKNTVCSSSSRLRG